MDQGPHRFPWRITAIVAAVVVVASVATGLILARDRVRTEPGDGAAVATVSATTDASVPSGVDPTRAVTVLLTVRDADGSAASSLLLSVGDTDRPVTELLLPRALLLGSDPPRRLSHVSTPNGGSLATAPLQTLLGARVDAVVDLDRLGWGGLIDATGSRIDPTIGQQPGSFPLVVDTVLAGLPADAGRVGQLLTGLGSMARTTVTNEDAGRVLADIGRQLRKNGSTREVLPVTYVRTGIDRAAVVRRAETDALVARLFPDAVLTTGHDGPLRVVVQRAGASVGAEMAARLALAADGLGVVTDRPAGTDTAVTKVIVPNASADAMAAGRQVAAALGLPGTAVSIDAESSQTVDARVLLGSDAPVATP